MHQRLSVCVPVTSSCVQTSSELSCDCQGEAGSDGGKATSQQQCWESSETELLGYESIKHTVNVNTAFPCWHHKNTSGLS